MAGDMPGGRAGGTGTNDSAATTGWWRRLTGRFPAVVAAPGAEESGSGTEWQYLWLLPGDAACALVPATATEPTAR